jgi:hypothetical protein
VKESLRAWQSGDPEPSDHPDVVDAEGDVWSWEPWPVEVLEIDPLQPDEDAGGWWLKTGPYAGGDLWPWSEVTSSGPVREYVDES